jgi:hypothetical protein
LWKENAELLTVQTWHEKWGEDYAKGGDACLKWTDRWSDTMLEGGGQRSQGDKWREEFSGGTGRKNGETWFVDESGHRYGPSTHPKPLSSGFIWLCSLALRGQCPSISTERFHLW